MRERVTRDGNVAVLLSPGYGAGWVTWGAVNPFEPALVRAIERGAKPEELTRIAEELYPDEYYGGVEDLVVVWLPEGTLFRYNEYDGAESLETLENTEWIVA